LLPYSWEQRYLIFADTIEDEKEEGMPDMIREPRKGKIPMKADITLCPPLDGYWPDERPFRVLIKNLQLLTRAEVLDWTEYPTAEGHYSVIQTGLNSTDLNSIVGEVTTELLGYTIGIYKTEDRKNRLYFLLAVACDGTIRRTIESDEHRNFRLCGIYDAAVQGKIKTPNGQRSIPSEKIDTKKARERASETLNSIMFLVK